jgi:hypothetical protein
MLDVLLFDDLCDFVLPDFEALDFSSLIEALPDALVLSEALGVLVLAPAEELLAVSLLLVPEAPMLEEPLPVLELLPLAP